MQLPADFDKYQLIRQQQAAEELALERPPGHLKPRERLALLFDKGAYEELFRFARSLKDSNWQDGMICAYGEVNGQPVAAYATEYQVQGGSLGVAQTRQVAELYRLACQSGIPVVALLESGGARIDEGVHIMEGYGAPMREAVFASGVVPQIACVFGHCIGATAIMATLCDFVVMEANSTLSVAGARVNATATGEKLSEQQLGGVEVHTRYTGLAHFVCQGEPAVLEQARELLAWLPANHSQSPPRFETQDPFDRQAPEVRQLIPSKDTTAFDLRLLIESFSDEGQLLEVQAEYCPQMLTGFAAFGGRAVGVVGNQSLHMAGAVDPDGARKLSRFLNFLASFNYPLITFLDVPGALPNLQAQKQGMLQALSQLLHSQYLVRELKLTIVVRRCFGGTYCMMHPKVGEGDLIFAYPNAMIGVMSDAAMTQVMSQQRGLKAKADLLHAQGLRLDDPLLAAAGGYIDDIIDPADTRRMIIKALKTFGNKRVWHYPPKLSGNPPL